MSAPDVRRLLEDLGSIEPPPPDPDFIDRLEFQLRAEAIALAPETTYDDAPWRVPFGIAAAAFTVVAGVAGITVIRDMPDRQVSAQLVAASNARVTLPNGEEYEAEPGMVIPKGAVVEVFSGGLAEIAGGITLAPGSRVVVTDEGVRTLTGDEMPLSDDVQMAAPGEGADRSQARRIDPSFPGRDSEPAAGDDVSPGVPVGDDAGPLRQAERTTKSRGLDALRRITGDAAPPQTSVAGPGPSVDHDVTSTDQPAPSTNEPETTTAPAPAPPESVPATDPPATDAPTAEPPVTTMPEPQVPTPAPPPAPTVPLMTPPATVPDPTPPPTTTLDPSVPAVPPSGTTTTTTPDVDPAGGEDGGEVTPPGVPGTGDGGGSGAAGNPTGYDGSAATQPKTSDDPASGDEQAAAETDADADSGDTGDGSGAGTDETAAADPVAAE